MPRVDATGTITHAFMRPLDLVHTAARFALASKAGQRQLLGIGWSITNLCNSRCPFCSRHSGPRGPSLEVALGIVDQLAEMGCRRVHLTGGEPLVRKDLPPLLDRIRDLGMSSSINTNGALLAESRPIVDRCDAFVVSVDGPEEIHDAYRGAGSYRNMLRGLDVLATAGKRFAFSVALFRRNLEEIDFFVDLARRHGTFIVLQPGALHVIGSKESNPEAPDLIRYREVMRSVLEDPEKRRFVWNSTPALEILMRFPAEHDLPCHAGRITCRLEVDGKLYPCSRTVGDARCHDAPDVFELGVKEAWRRLPAVDCRGAQCWAAHNIEKNLLFSWNPSTVWNLLTRNYAERRRRPDA